MSARSALPSPMGSAALQIVRRGWPVFPCREATIEKTNSAGKTIRLTAKAPYTGKGLKDATRDETRINAWWRDHPGAMIGVPMGRATNGCFVLDLDPRSEEKVDPDTGEISIEEWTLEQLKADLEAQIGCTLPSTLTSRTPSGGVHLWFRQPVEGDEIRNRGNLPKHVDVRGAGGYVIAPPSILADGGEYRFISRLGDWRDDAAIAEAPAALIDILRSKSAREAPPRVPARPSGGRTAPARPPAGDVSDAVRRYALAALDGECRRVREAGSGSRNAQLNESAFKVATLVAAGWIDAGTGRASIEAAAAANPGRDDAHQIAATIDSGWTAGIEQPRDLSEVAAASRSRPRSVQGGGSPRPSAPAPDLEDYGAPTSHSGGRGSGSPGNGAGGRAGNPQGDNPEHQCAFRPQTDLGNLERFLRRFGHDFLFVEQWGWLAWDGRRWNRDMAMALLGRAVQQTMRAIQDEAKFVRESGCEKGWAHDATEAEIAEVQEANKHRHDRVVKVARNGDITLLSDTIAKWGRTSEGAGHISCISKMAESRLSARTSEFDADPLLLNVANGTLAFSRPKGAQPAGVVLRPHERADRMTKIAAADYVPGARCPRFDAFLAEVQPVSEMRDFLDVWSGYNALGLADAQKMVIFYGQGSNGKGVWTTTIAHILGDYSWAAAIETFIDQGKYRKGSDASPDLAALAGRRMVHANEPEEGSKFSDGLIKSLTSDDPIGGVRELMKSPFELIVTFTNTVSCNHRPKIGTDHGIQRRVIVVPWDVIIPDERADAQLKVKLRAESSGILNRMVRGALVYLDSGLPMPDAVREATREYQEENDLLGQFLTLCVERREGCTLGAGALHALFAAWQTWSQQLNAQGKSWSAKYLNAQMQRKGYRVRKSSSMLWDDVFPLYRVEDFINHEGKPVTDPLPPPSSQSPSSPASHPDDDHDPWDD